MIDFSVFPRRNKTYDGTGGGKLSIDYNGELYMLKFPNAASNGRKRSGNNGCVSEHLGSRIFESVGIPAQKTLLGVYSTGEKNRIVVACEDFTRHGTVFQSFASLKNTVIDQVQSGTVTELSSIISSIDAQQAMDPEILKRFFWDMFIVDALIANRDRHNGNWGFIYNTRTDELDLAPVFDCAGCLFPQSDEELMGEVLSEQPELDARIYNIPTSAITQNGSRINYYNFITSLSDSGCCAALKRIVPSIDMGRINALIDAVPIIGDIQKDFYKTILAERKARILDKALSLLRSKERTGKLWL